MTGVAWTRPRVMVVSRCTSSFGPSRGGADVIAQRHAVLIAQDADVVYVGTSGLRDEHIQNVQIATRDLVTDSPRSAGYLANEALHVVHGTLAALQAERQFPVDLIVSNSSISTVLLKLFSRRPVVHYIHDGLYSRDTAPARLSARQFGSFVLNRLIEKLAIRMADKVICASHTIATQAVSAGAPESKLTVMYPLLRRLERKIPSSDRPLEKLPMPIQQLRPYLLSVGQQTGRKRFDCLIDALRFLPEPLNLVIVGDGPLHDSYRAQVASRDLSDRVVFLRAVDDALLDTLYHGCAAFVLASENEGFPISVAEALTRGRPCILACPSSEGLPMALDNDFLVVLSNLSVYGLVPAIQEALLRSTEDPESQRRSIRRWANSTFPSEEKIREDYDRIFRSLVETPAATATA